MQSRVVTVGMLICFALAGWHFASNPTSETSVAESTLAVPAIASELSSADASGLTTTSIQDIRLGRRVAGSNPIQAVEAGERVWAYDVVTSDWRLCQVRQTFERDYEGDSVFVTVEDETVESTFRHPYWVVRGEALADRPLLDHHVAIPENATTPGRWVDAGDLQIGDVLLLRDGRQVPVQSIELKPVAQKVYNFEVEDLHNYAVGHLGILAHNNNGDEGIGGALGAAMGRGMKVVRGPSAPDEMVGVLQSIGKPMDRQKIREVIHEVKRKMNIGANEDLVFDRSGGIWDSRTGEFIGKMWEAF